MIGIFSRICIVKSTLLTKGSLRSKLFQTSIVSVTAIQ